MAQNEITDSLSSDNSVLNSIYGHVGRVQSCWSRIAKIMARLSGWIYLFTAFFIGTDVILRKYFGVSSKATDEFSIYALAIASAFGMAYALNSKAHVRVELIYLIMPIRVKVLMNLITFISALFVFSFLVYYMAALVYDSYFFSTTSTSVYHTPLIWPQAAWLLGYIVFLVAIFIATLDILLGLIVRGPEHIATKYGPPSLEITNENSLDQISQ